MDSYKCYYSMELCHYEMEFLLKNSLASFYIPVSLAYCLDMLQRDSNTCQRQSQGQNDPRIIYINIYVYFSRYFKHMLVFFLQILLFIQPRYIFQQMTHPLRLRLRVICVFNSFVIALEQWMGPISVHLHCFKIISTCGIGRDSYPRTASLFATSTFSSCMQLLAGMDQPQMPTCGTTLI